MAAVRLALLLVVLQATLSLSAEVVELNEAEVLPSNPNGALAGQNKADTKAAQAGIQDATRKELFKQVGRGYKEVFGKDVDLSGEDEVTMSKSQKAMLEIRRMKKAYEAFSGKRIIPNDESIAPIYPQKRTLSNFIHHTLRTMWKNEKQMLGGHLRHMGKIPHPPRSTKDIMQDFHKAKAEMDFAWRGIPYPKHLDEKLNKLSKGGIEYKSTSKTARNMALNTLKKRAKYRQARDTRRATAKKVQATNKRIRKSAKMQKFPTIEYLQEAASPTTNAAKTGLKKAHKAVQQAKQVLTKTPLPKDSATGKYGAKATVHVGKSSMQASADVIAKAEVAVAKANKAGIHIPSNLAAMHQPSVPISNAKPPKHQPSKRPSKSTQKRVKFKSCHHCMHQCKTHNCASWCAMQFNDCTNPTEAKWHAMMHARANAIEKRIKAMRERKTKAKLKKKKSPKMARKAPSKDVKKPKKVKVGCHPPTVHCLLGRYKEIQHKADEARHDAYVSQRRAAISYGKKQQDADFTAEQDKVVAGFMQSEADRVKARAITIQEEQRKRAKEKNRKGREKVRKKLSRSKTKNKKKKAKRLKKEKKEAKKLEKGRKRALKRARKIRVQKAKEAAKAKGKVMIAKAVKVAKKKAIVKTLKKLKKEKKAKQPHSDHKLNRLKKVARNKRKIADRLTKELKLANKQRKSSQKIRKKNKFISDSKMVTPKP